MSKTLYQTPIGTARYCHLAKPDTKFNPEGRYSVELILDDADFARVKKDVDDIVDKQGFKNKARLNLPYQELDDGTKLIKATSAYRPFVVDSRGKITFDPRTHDPKNFPRIGSGSRLRLLVKMNPYTTLGGGVSLQLSSVQIASLVEYGCGGFGEIEGGNYVGESASRAEPSPTMDALSL